MKPKWTNRLSGIPAQPSDCLKSVLWKEDKKPQIWSESPWESKSTVLGIIGSKQYSQLMDGFLGHWTWDQCNMWVQTPLIRRTAITVASTWAKRQRFDRRSKMKHDKLKRLIFPVRLKVFCSEPYSPHKKPHFRLMLPTIDLKWEREVNNRKVILNFLFSHSEWKLQIQNRVRSQKGRPPFLWESVRNPAKSR